ncbi:MAG: hypothetical protein QM765_43135 [Myxococcales bacterium]
MSSGGETPGGISVGAGEMLLQVRCGVWRALLPLRSVVRVLDAALPSALPVGGPGARPVLTVGRETLPVVFAEVLLGAGEVTLRASHKMVAVSDGDGRTALLWVSAVEDVVAAPAPGPGESAAPMPGGAPLLDVPKLLAELAG